MKRSNTRAEFSQGSGFHGPKNASESEFFERSRIARTPEPNGDFRALINILNDHLSWDVSVIESSGYHCVKVNHASDHVFRWLTHFSVAARQHQVRCISIWDKGALGICGLERENSPEGDFISRIPQIRGAAIYQAYTSGPERAVIIFDPFGEEEILFDTCGAFGLFNVKLIRSFMAKKEYQSLIDIERAFNLAADEFEIPSDRRPDALASINRVLELARGRAVYDVIAVPTSNEGRGLEWPTVKYSDVNASTGINIVDFLYRFWEPLIANGATRVDLRRVDPSADAAVANYTAVRPDGTRRVLPPEIHPPTKKEINDQMVSQIRLSARQLETVRNALRNRL